jgi:hypothetical protein
VEASAENVFGRLNQAQAAFDAAKAEGTSRSQLTLIIVWTWAGCVVAYIIAAFIVLFRVPIDKPESVQAAIS